MEWYESPLLNNTSESDPTGLEVVGLAPLPAAGALLLAGRSGEMASTLPGNTEVAVWPENLDLATEQLWAAPDGAWALACDGEGLSVLLDVPGQKIHRRFDAQGTVNAAAFDPNGQYVATASVVNGLQRWEVATGARRDSLPHFGRALRSVAISPDGKTLLSGAENGDLFVWDALNRRCLDTLHQNSRVGALAFAPNGRVFASADKDGSILIWDAAARQVFRQLPYPKANSTVRSLCFSADGEYLLVHTEEQEVYLWRVPSTPRR